MESFAPWIARLEKRITERVLDEISRAIPPAWYDDDYDALLQLLAYTAERIRGKTSSSEFTAVPDPALHAETSATALCAIPCAMRALSPCPWKASRCGWPRCAR